MRKSKIVTISTSSIRTKFEFREEIYNHFTNLLRERFKITNLDLLGDGCFAYVYQHPWYTNRVIKVALNSSCYCDYICWCSRNQDNPYVPKLDSIEIFDITTSTYYNHAVIVVMEKLQPIMRSGHLKDLMNYITNVDNHQPKRILTHRNFKKIKKVKDFIRDKNFFSPCAIDLHSENIMRRGSQLVITDPVVG